MNLNPPFKYYGSKYNMLKHILPLIPKHIIYVEPFFGSGAVFFSKPRPTITRYFEVINDYNLEVINFFEQLRDNSEELIEKIYLTPNSEYEYKSSKLISEQDSKVEKARKFYVRAMQSFAGDMSGGWSRSKTTNQTAVYLNRVDKLRLYVERLRETTITCNDALNVIKNYDSPYTFFYIDPPYPNSNQGHYKGYTIEDYRQLINTLETLQGSFILSNYPQIEITYPDTWVQYQFTQTLFSKKITSNSGLKRPKKIEMLYYKPRTGALEQKEQKIYDSGSLDCFIKG